MYYYNSEFHSAKPHGTEYKTSMAKVSFVLGMEVGDRFNLFRKPTPPTLVIETEGQLRGLGEFAKGNGFVRVGNKYWIEVKKYKAVSLQLMKQDYFKEQEIRYSEDLNSPFHQPVQIDSYGFVYYAVKGYESSNFYILGELVINGKAKYCLYDKEGPDYIFKGFSDNINSLNRDIINLNYRH